MSKDKRRPASPRKPAAPAVDLARLFRQAMECHQAGQLLRAEGLYREVLRRRPNLPEALCNRGSALIGLRRFEEALASLDRALAVRPNYVEALINRGDALRELNRPEEALASCERAIALQPGAANAFCNRGNALVDLRRLDEALVSYAEAERLAPDHVTAHCSESACRLLGGDLLRGWEKYEWRWRAGGGPAHREFAQPRWRGEPLRAGQRILLHAEQGLGDTIQFCRYAPLVAALGAEVILEVQAPLKPLLATLPGVRQLLARGEPLPDFDLHCPLLSLPLAFHTELATIPAPQAYLAADGERIARWETRLGGRRATRVGLAWSGSPFNRHDHHRSIPLQLLTTFIRPDIDLVSLQPDVRPDDRRVLEAHPEIRDFGAALGDFAETAALIACLDLVICADTVIAHLAGALGKPVWILLAFTPDWRWLLDRADSPWYPTARLFRQPRPGDWASVIERVRGEQAGTAA